VGREAVKVIIEQVTNGWIVTVETHLHSTALLKEVLRTEVNVFHEAADVLAFLTGLLR
jgi:hypothetical protein